MRTQYRWDEPETIDLAVEKLQAGKILISSTDTVMGFMAVPSEAAWQRLNEIKERTDKPYLLLAKSWRDVTPYVAQVSSQAEQIMQAYCPGPVTLIVPARESTPSYMKSDRNAIAVRIPDHAGLQALLAECGLLFSTSANRSGMPTAISYEELDPELVDEAAFVIADPTPANAQPSTIVDCTHPVPRVIRQGAVVINPDLLA